MEGDAQSIFRSEHVPPPFETDGTDLYTRLVGHDDELSTKENHKA